MDLDNYDVAVAAILGTAGIIFALTRMKHFFNNGMPKRIDELDKRADRQREDIVKLQTMVGQLVKTMDEERVERKKIYELVLKSGK